MGILMQSCSETPSSSSSSYILLTYRSSILPALPSTTYTSDSGWGCMLRVTQMFIANYLHLHLSHPLSSVLPKFIDNSPTHYSIQLLTNHGTKQFNKKNTDWYTPAEGGYLIQHFLQHEEKDVRVNICQDNCLFWGEVKVDRPEVVVLLMARIGLDEPQGEYLKVVVRFAQSRFFGGVLGGKPKYAHLFVETRNEGKVWRYLDPHKTRPAIRDREDLEERKEEFEGKLYEMAVGKIDPSMCIAFRFKTEEFEEWKAEMEKIKEEFKSDFFIYMTEEAPTYNEDDIIEIVEDDD